MSAKLTVDIVSPLGQVLFSKTTDFIIAPSYEGEMTVLPGHINAICLLNSGRLKLDDGTTFVIFKGIMEITDGDRIIIASDKIKNVADLEKATVLGELSSVEERLLKELLDDTSYEELYQKYKDLLAELTAFE